MKLPFTDARQACNEVHDIPGVPGWLTVRPFNPYAPLETAWWLIPTTEFPAHGTGKFYFHSRDQRLSAGLRMEKGWTAEIRKLFGLRQSRVMHPGWIWYSLRRDMHDGQLMSRMQEVRAPHELEITLQITGPETGESWERKLPRDKYRWRWLAQSQKLECSSAESLGDYLPEAARVTSLPELSRVLDSLDSISTLWGDMWLGRNYELVAEDDPAVRRAAAIELFERDLKPFARWVRRWDSAQG